MLNTPQDDEETGEFEPYELENPLDPIDESEDLISAWDELEAEMYED